MNLSQPFFCFLLYILSVSLLLNAAPYCECPYKIPRHRQPTESSCMLGHFVQLLIDLVSYTPPKCPGNDTEDKENGEESLNKQYLIHLINDVMEETHKRNCLYCNKQGHADGSCVTDNDQDKSEDLMSTEQTTGKSEETTRRNEESLSTVSSDEENISTIRTTTQGINKYEENNSEEIVTVGKEVTSGENHSSEDITFTKELSSETETNTTSNADPRNENPTNREEHTTVTDETATLHQSDPKHGENKSLETITIGNNVLDQVTVENSTEELSQENEANNTSNTDNKQIIKKPTHREEQTIEIDETVEESHSSESIESTEHSSETGFNIKSDGGTKQIAGDPKTREEDPTKRNEPATVALVDDRHEGKKSAETITVEEVHTQEKINPSKNIASTEEHSSESELNITNSTETRLIGEDPMKREEHTTRSDEASTADPSDDDHGEKKSAETTTVEREVHSQVTVEANDSSEKITLKEEHSSEINVTSSADTKQTVEQPTSREEQTSANDESTTSAQGDDSLEGNKPAEKVTVEKEVHSQVTIEKGHPSENIRSKEEHSAETESDIASSGDTEENIEELTNREEHTTESDDSATAAAPSDNRHIESKSAEVDTVVKDVLSQVKEEEKVTLSEEHSSETDSNITGGGGTKQNVETPTSREEHSPASDESAISTQSDNKHDENKSAETVTLNHSSENISSKEEDFPETLSNVTSISDPKQTAEEPTNKEGHTTERDEPTTVVPTGNKQEQFPASDGSASPAQSNNKHKENESAEAVTVSHFLENITVREEDPHWTIPQATEEAIYSSENVTFTEKPSSEAEARITSSVDPKQTVEKPASREEQPQASDESTTSAQVNDSLEGNKLAEEVIVEEEVHSQVTIEEAHSSENIRSKEEHSTETESNIASSGDTEKNIEEFTNREEHTTESDEPATAAAPSDNRHIGSKSAEVDTVVKDVLSQVKEEEKVTFSEEHSSETKSNITGGGGTKQNVEEPTSREEHTPASDESAISTQSDNKHEQNKSAETVTLNHSSENITLKEEDFPETVSNVTSISDPRQTAEEPTNKEERTIESDEPATAGPPDNKHEGNIPGEMTTLEKEVHNQMKEAENYSSEKVTFTEKHSSEAESNITSNADTEKAGENPTSRGKHTSVSDEPTTADPSDNKLEESKYTGTITVEKEVHSQVTVKEDHSSENTTFTEEHSSETGTNTSSVDPKQIAENPGNREEENPTGDETTAAPSDNKLEENEYAGTVTGEKELHSQVTLEENDSSENIRSTEKHSSETESNTASSADKEQTAEDLTNREEHTTEREVSSSAASSDNKHVDSKSVEKVTVGKEGESSMESSEPTTSAPSDNKHGENKSSETITVEKEVHDQVTVEKDHSSEKVTFTEEHSSETNVTSTGDTNKIVEKLTSREEQLSASDVGNKSAERVTVEKEVHSQVEKNHSLENITLTEVHSSETTNQEHTTETVGPESATLSGDKHLEDITAETVTVEVVKEHHSPENITLTEEHSPETGSNITSIADTRKTTESDEPTTAAPRDNNQEENTSAETVRVEKEVHSQVTLEKNNSSEEVTFTEEHSSETESNITSSADTKQTFEKSTNKGEPTSDSDKSATADPSYNKHDENESITTGATTIGEDIHPQVTEAGNHPSENATFTEKHSSEAESNTASGSDTEQTVKELTNKEEHNTKSLEPATTILSDDKHVESKSAESVEKDVLSEVTEEKHHSSEIIALTEEHPSVTESSSAVTMKTDEKPTNREEGTTERAAGAPSDNKHEEENKSVETITVEKEVHSQVTVEGEHSSDDTTLTEHSSANESIITSGAITRETDEKPTQEGESTTESAPSDNKHGGNKSSETITVVKEVHSQVTVEKKHSSENTNKEEYTTESYVAATAVPSVKHEGNVSTEATTVEKDVLSQVTVEKHHSSENITLTEEDSLGTGSNGTVAENDSSVAKSNTANSDHTEQTAKELTNEGEHTTESLETTTTTPSDDKHVESKSAEIVTAEEDLLSKVREEKQHPAENIASTEEHSSVTESSSAVTMETNEKPTNREEGTTERAAAAPSDIKHEVENKAVEIITVEKEVHSQVTVEGKHSSENTTLTEEHYSANESNIASGAVTRETDEKPTNKREDTTESVELTTAATGDKHEKNKSSEAITVVKEVHSQVLVEEKHSPENTNKEEHTTESYVAATAVPSDKHEGNVSTEATIEKDVLSQVTVEKHHSSENITLTEEYSSETGSNVTSSADTEQTFEKPTNNSSENIALTEEHSSVTESSNREEGTTERAAAVPSDNKHEVGNKSVETITVEKEEHSQVKVKDKHTSENTTLTEEHSSANESNITSGTVTRETEGTTDSVEPTSAALSDKHEGNKSSETITVVKEVHSQVTVEKNHSSENTNKEQHTTESYVAATPSDNEHGRNISTEATAVEKEVHTQVTEAGDHSSENATFTEKYSSKAESNSASSADTKQAVKEFTNREEHATESSEPATTTPSDNKHVENKSAETITLEEEVQSQVTVEEKHSSENTKITEEPSSAHDTNTNSDDRKQTVEKPLNREYTTERDEPVTASPIDNSYGKNTSAETITIEKEVHSQVTTTRDEKYEGNKYADEPTNEEEGTTVSDKPATAAPSDKHEENKSAETITVEKEVHSQVTVEEKHSSENTSLTEVPSSVYESNTNNSDRRQTVENPSNREYTTERDQPVTAAPIDRNYVKNESAETVTVEKGVHSQVTATRDEKLEGNKNAAEPTNKEEVTTESDKPATAAPSDKHEEKKSEETIIVEKEVHSQVTTEEKHTNNDDRRQTVETPPNREYTTQRDEPVTASPSDNNYGKNKSAETITIEKDVHSQVTVEEKHSSENTTLTEVPSPVHESNTNNDERRQTDGKPSNREYTIERDDPVTASPIDNNYEKNKSAETITVEKEVQSQSSIVAEKDLFEGEPPTTVATTTGEASSQSTVKEEYDATSDKSATGSLGTQNQTIHESAEQIAVEKTTEKLQHGEVQTIVKKNIFVEHSKEEERHASNDDNTTTNLPLTPKEVKNEAAVVESGPSTEQYNDKSTLSTSAVEYTTTPSKEIESAKKVIIEETSFRESAVNKEDSIKQNQKEYVTSMPTNEGNSDYKVDKEYISIQREDVKAGSTKESTIYEEYSTMPNGTTHSAIETDKNETYTESTRDETEYSSKEASYTTLGYDDTRDTVEYTTAHINTMYTTPKPMGEESSGSFAIDKGTTTIQKEYTRKLEEPERKENGERYEDRKEYATSAEKSTDKKESSSSSFSSSSSTSSN